MLMGKHTAAFTSTHHHHLDLGFHVSISVPQQFPKEPDPTGGDSWSMRLQALQNCFVEMKWDSILGVCVSKLNGF